jgi:hypothetical protein
MEYIQNKNTIFIKNEMNIEEETMGTLEQKPCD